MEMASSVELLNKLLDIQTARRKLESLISEEAAHQLIGHINRDLDQPVLKLLEVLG
ncbi:hypothetical protein [Motiliproteus sp. SC1-56]|uniref:hypothetical protein n=1 Tax=Motiliproteus sp. SC1-56 TaxID=2799565 RepID=UPI001A8E1E15|nr:hypothetical protein [Motiliproteus sp. SC1-56]